MKVYKLVSGFSINSNSALL